MPVSNTNVLFNTALVFICFGVVSNRFASYTILVVVEVVSNLVWFLVLNVVSCLESCIVCICMFEALESINNCNVESCVVL
jgi:hypothetical protein